MMIAILNAVLEDGGKDDIIAIAVVENEHEGELWFNENKPDDGTQVDYSLHNISEVFAAPDLLAACEDALEIIAGERITYDFFPPKDELVKILEKIVRRCEKKLEIAITKAK